MWPESSETFPASFYWLSYSSFRDHRSATAFKLIQVLTAFFLAVFLRVASYRTLVFFHGSSGRGF